MKITNIGAIAKKYGVEIDYDGFDLTYKVRYKGCCVRITNEYSDDEIEKEILNFVKAVDAGKVEEYRPPFVNHDEIAIDRQIQAMKPKPCNCSGSYRSSSRSYSDSSSTNSAIFFSTLGY